MSLTVKQLITKLQAIKDQDALVVMAKDAEGNSYSPLASVEGCHYHADSTWAGYVVDDMSEGVEGTVPALLLCPTK